jgi:hypothetical protein
MQCIRRDAAGLEEKWCATTKAAQTGWGALVGLVPMRLSNVHQELSPAGATWPGIS